jgi:hypothetical protein
LKIGYLRKKYGQIIALGMFVVRRGCNYLSSFT